MEGLHDAEGDVVAGRDGLDFDHGNVPQRISNFIFVNLFLNQICEQNNFVKPFFFTRFGFCGR